MTKLPKLRLCFEVGEHATLVLCRVDKLRRRKGLHIWQVKSATTVAHHELLNATDPVAFGMRAVNEYVHVNVPEVTA
jgi:hypothetical protein